MTIAQTLRELGNWDYFIATSLEDTNLAMKFYDDLYPDFLGVDDDQTRHLLLLMSAEVAEEEGVR